MQESVTNITSEDVAYGFEAAQNELFRAKVTAVLRAMHECQGGCRLDGQNSASIRQRVLPLCGIRFLLQSTWREWLRRTGHGVHGVRICEIYDCPFTKGIYMPLPLRPKNSHPTVARQLSKSSQKALPKSTVSLQPFVPLLPLSAHDSSTSSSSSSSSSSFSGEEEKQDDNDDDVSYIESKPAWFNENKRQVIDLTQSSDDE